MNDIIQNKRHNLPIIENSNGNSNSHYEHSLNKNELTWKSLLRENIERCISKAKDFDEFLSLMEQEKCEIKSNNNNVPLMLSINETAKLLGITPHYARQLALSGKVKAVRVGRGKILINVQSVVEFFNNNYINSTPEKQEITIIKPIPIKL